MIDEASFEFYVNSLYQETLTIQDTFTNHVPFSFELIFCDLLVLGLEVCRAEKLCANFWFNVYASDDIDTLLLFNTIQIGLVVYLLPW